MSPRLDAWGRAASGPADLEVRGRDADLAAAARDHPGALVRFVPDPGSDVARALGIAGPPRPEATTELPLDALRVGTNAGAEAWSVNAVVLGPPPDRLREGHRRARCTVEVDGRVCFEGRATTVVVAVGEHLRGADLVPRGHPGDGRAEVQVYALAPGERAGMRRRLPQGVHVPHPRIEECSGRRIRVRFARPGPLEADGVPVARVAALDVEVVPGAVRLLV